VSGNFSEPRKHYSKRREAFQNPESIIPSVGKLFRIPKVLFHVSRNFSESRKLLDASKNAFGVPEMLPEGEVEIECLTGSL
jgi:hypothetical protein